LTVIHVHSHTNSLPVGL